MCVCACVRAGVCVCVCVGVSAHHVQPIVEDGDRDGVVRRRELEVAHLEQVHLLPRHEHLRKRANPT